MTPVSLRDASKIERALPAIRIKRKRRFPLAAKRDQPIRLGSLCDLKPPEVIDKPNPREPPVEPSGPFIRCDLEW